MSNKNYTVIKVYNKFDVVKFPGAVFWYSQVEEDGMLTLKVRDYKQLKPNQKYVYFYKIYSITSKPSSK